MKYGTRAWFEDRFIHASGGHDKWGHQWRAIQRYRYLLSLDVIRGAVSLRSGQDILDMGCGLGDFCEMVRELNPNNRVYGGDISLNAVRGARQKYPRVHFLCEALPEIGFRSPFDGLIALGCINYLSRKARSAALANIHHHLRPGGWFLFSTPIDDGRRYFSVRGAVNALTEAGFRLQKTAYSYGVLHRAIERPLRRIASFSRILDEVSRHSPNELTPRKRFLKRAVQRKRIGTPVRKTLSTLSETARDLVGSMALVRLSQGLAKRILKQRGASHMIVLASRDA